MRRFNTFVCLALLTLSVIPTHADEAVDASARFSEWAKTAGDAIRSSPDYAHPHCDFDALIVGNGIVRVSDSGQVSLKAGDLVLAVNGKRVDAKDRHGVWTILKEHSADEKVTILISRNGVEKSIRANCQSSVSDKLPRLTALNAAAAGDFKTCSMVLRDANAHFLLSGNYSLLTSCQHRSGELSTQDVAIRRVQYWALRFQEEKRYPEQIQALRPSVVGEITRLEQSGQNRLAAELDSMLATASGVQVPVPRPPIAVVPAAPPKPSVSYPSAAPYHASRAASNDCESGHWIESVSDDGEIVKLEDGSVWKVSGADTVDSALWLPTEEIAICDGELINTDDSEKVDATRLR